VCKDGKPIEADGSRVTVSQVDRQVVVQVMETTVADAGEYTFTAVNERGKIHHAVTVDIIPAGLEYVHLRAAYCKAVISRVFWVLTLLPFPLIKCKNTCHHVESSAVILTLFFVNQHVVVRLSRAPTDIDGRQSNPSAILSAGVCCLCRPTMSDHVARP